jgi:hypothetical protein
MPDDNENGVPLHSATPEVSPEARASKHVRFALQSRTAEDIANEQTAEQLALRLWVAMVADKVLSGMSGLMDELLQSHLLDDDDEEGDDEGWLDDHAKREKKLLDEAITEALVEYPDINAINNLPPSSDQNIAWDADQLRDVLAKCAIGATEFRRKFPRAHLENRVKSDLKKRFERDPKYSKHVRGDVPGANIKVYGSRGRTSSKGTFVKTNDYASGGGLDTLLTGGSMRVCKDRIDPVAWSHQYGLQRKTERQDWRHHFVITECNGKQSNFELPRDMLAGSGAPAVRFLTKAGVHIVGRDGVQKALVQFLRFKPKREIVRVPRVGWAQIGERWIFVRPDGVITPADMPQARHTSYLLDATATRHGLHLAGTATECDRDCRATRRQLECGVVVCDVLRGALVVLGKRAGGRTSSPWSFDHRQNDDLRRGSVYLWLAARDCRQRLRGVLGRH